MRAGTGKTIHSKTILNNNCLVLVTSRMMSPCGLLEGEGIATCFAPLFDGLNEEVHDNVHVGERHDMPNEGGEIARCTAISLSQRPTSQARPVLAPKPYCWGQTRCSRARALVARALLLLHAFIFLQSGVVAPSGGGRGPGTQQLAQLHRKGRRFRALLAVPR